MNNIGLKCICKEKGTKRIETILNKRQEKKNTVGGNGLLHFQTGPTAVVMTSAKRIDL